MRAAASLIAADGTEGRAAPEVARFGAGSYCVAHSPAALVCKLACMALCILGISSSIHAQQPPKDRYVAPWIALPNGQRQVLTASGKEWTGVVALRPMQVLVLDSPIVERGRAEQRVPADTLMTAMDDAARIACELERPKGRYFIHCVEDTDANGSYDEFFFLNNTLPYMFSAIRQPRHRHATAIDPVTLHQAAEDQVPDVQLALGSKGQLCVLRQKGFNIWGDQTEMSGCLRKSGASRQGPQVVTLAGRLMVIERPDSKSARITVSAQPDTVPVEL